MSRLEHHLRRHRRLVDPTAEATIDLTDRSARGASARTVAPARTATTASTAEATAPPAAPCGSLTFNFIATDLDPETGAYHLSEDPATLLVVQLLERAGRTAAPATPVYVLDDHNTAPMRRRRSRRPADGTITLHSLGMALCELHLGAAPVAAGAVGH